MFEHFHARNDAVGFGLLLREIFVLQKLKSQTRLSIVGKKETLVASNKVQALLPEDLEFLILVQIVLLAYQKVLKNILVLTG